LQARQLDGGSYTLAAHKGEVVILNFWATWCVPCRVELPAFSEFYRKHQAEGLTVLAVSMDDPEDLAKVRDVAKALPFPAAMYGDTQAQGYGRIWRLPITFVIGRDGRAALRRRRGRARHFRFARSGGEPSDRCLVPDNGSCCSGVDPSGTPAMIAAGS